MNAVNAIVLVTDLRIRRDVGILEIHLHIEFVGRREVLALAVATIVLAPGSVEVVGVPLVAELEVQPGLLVVARPERRTGVNIVIGLIPLTTIAEIAATVGEVVVLPHEEADVERIGDGPVGPHAGLCDGTIVLHGVAPNIGRKQIDVEASLKRKIILLLELGLRLVLSPGLRGLRLLGEDTTRQHNGRSREQQLLHRTTPHAIC